MNHPPNRRISAAQYLRMSSEHQHYSAQNQVEAIAGYASLNQIEVIHTYADLGRSGFM
jgi:DNA invertase Pin-like site-specific DNA recombinase